MPLERFQKRQNEQCSKILEPGGGEAFWGSQQVEKIVKKASNLDKTIGSGKELGLGLTGTSSKPFFGLRQGAKHGKLQRFHKFRSRKNMSQRRKNCVNIEVEWTGVEGSGG